MPGCALGLAVANGALLVSTDTGAIISFDRPTTNQAPGFYSKWET